MKTIYFDGQLSSGAYIQNAMVIVNDDCGMNELVRTIKANGYKSFKLSTMHKLVKI